MERYPKLIKKSFAGKIKELAVELFGMKENKGLKSTKLKDIIFK